jgi:hypothetical protein
MPLGPPGLGHPEVIASAQLRHRSTGTRLRVGVPVM